MDKPILFRCSRLGDLMTEPKSKSDPLSKTTESFVKSMWLEREFGYREEFASDEIMKGWLCEDDSVGLVKEVLGGEFRIKNSQYIRNDFVHGTPDIILRKEDVVEDVKTSFNLRTFSESDLAKNYWWQGQGYMWLTGKKNYRLIYSLVPTPETIIEDQKRRWFYKFGQNEDNPHFIDACKQIDRNNELISELPKANRLNVFEFNFDEEKIEALKLRILSCREYYKKLALPMFQHKKEST